MGNWCCCCLSERHTDSSLFRLLGLLNQPFLVSVPCLFHRLLAAGFSFSATKSSALPALGATLTREHGSKTVPSVFVGNMGSVVVALSLWELFCG